MSTKNYIYKKSGWLLSVAFLTLSLSTLSSCDDWLDVRGENIQKEQDQYESYKGFRDALTGCYMTMGDQSIYGLKMTMTDIENLASLWYLSTSAETQTPLKYYLTHHDYSKTQTQTAVKSMFGGLFKTVVSANVLMKNLEENGANIQDNQARDVMLGETYAIRAYCQLDVLRLFGQLPQGGSKTVKLPYSYTTSIDEIPAYFSYSEYVSNLKKDIERAESLLKDQDPINRYSFNTLNSAPSDVLDLYYYRQSRLNYWAVRALHARMCLYLGETAEAHTIALDVIKSGTVSLSGISDLQNRYNALPSECLFYLSKYNVNDYANNYLKGNATADSPLYAEHYMITETMLEDLYASIPGSTASHNRYLNEWNRVAFNNAGVPSPTLKKYYYDPSTTSANSLMTKHQIIPMLRLSETYLIAIETSTSLEEAQELYDTYMSACAFPKELYEPFATIEEVRLEMPNEYRREFFGEGQMFYTYKRLAAKNMLWNNDEITENDYIIPLPATEYDPSLMSK